MNEATAKRTFDALSAGDGYVWDCRVLFKGGYFKANAIQLVQFPKAEASLKLIKRGSKAHDQHVYDLDLAKYSKEAVLELVRFLYLSETAFLATSVENDINQDDPGPAKKRKTDESYSYLAEEVWSLARELDIEELQKQCVKALNLAFVTITVDESNFQSSAELAVKMMLRPLLLKCFAFVKTKFVADPASTITELREQAPAFLNALVLELPYRIPPVADNVQDNTEQGVVIDPHNWDDKLFDEVLASLGGAVPTEKPLTDFEIHCTDTPPDRPIRCHRDILSRVSHFERMFRQNNEESREGFARVKAEKAVVMEVLKYLYSGCTNDLSRTLPQTTEDQETFIAEKVIDLAQQYGLYKLKQQAHEALLRCDISHSNVLRLVGVAVLYELDELKYKCLRCFFDNREVLLTTDQWQKADNTTLQTVTECVFLVSNDVDGFCVYDNRSVWTINMNGTKSSKIEVGGVCIGDPLIQLDNRTVMVLLDENQAKLFDLIDHSVADCSPLLFKHYFGSACLVNGDVYATGGYGNAAKVCERYNRATDTWHKVADMNRGRFVHALVEWKGSLLAIGGNGSGGSIERYDAVADEWEVIRESEERLGNARVRAAVINNELWLYTYSGPGPRCLWKVDLDADEWVEIPIPALTSCVTVLCMFEREGKAHLISWTRSDALAQQTNVFSSYDEATGVWNEVLQIDASNVCAIPIVR